MGKVGQKRVYPAIMALAGTNPTWHFIYDITCVQNEAAVLSHSNRGSVVKV